MGTSYHSHKWVPQKLHSLLPLQTYRKYPKVLKGNCTLVTKFRWHHMVASSFSCYVFSSAFAALKPQQQRSTTSCSREVNFSTCRVGRVANKPNARQVKWQQNSGGAKTRMPTLLAEFTIHGWFLPRQPRDNLSRFTAEIRSCCQVDKQTGFHDSCKQLQGQVSITDITCYYTIIKTAGDKKKKKISLKNCTAIKPVAFQLQFVAKC